MWIQSNPFDLAPRYLANLSQAEERIFSHVIYLIKSPPSHLALAKWWKGHDPRKLHPISRHFASLRLAE